MSPTMDNYQFNLIPIKEQAQYTWEHGTYLACKREKDFVINLYSGNNFLWRFSIGRRK